MAAAHPKRIAVIGSGIAGLACAWLLSSSTPKHEVRLAVHGVAFFSPRFFILYSVIFLFPPFRF